MMVGRSQVFKKLDIEAPLDIFIPNFEKSLKSFIRPHKTELVRLYKLGIVQPDKLLAQSVTNAAAFIHLKQSDTHI